MGHESRLSWQHVSSRACTARVWVCGSTVLASVCRRLGGPHHVAFRAYSLPNILLCWSQLCLKRAVLLDAHVASASCIGMLYLFDSGFVLLAGLLVMGGRQRFVLPSGTAVCGA